MDFDCFKIAQTSYGGKHLIEKQNKYYEPQYPHFIPLEEMALIFETK